MPGLGDQHKSNGTATANPFEENKPHISEYTALEIATLQSRLNKRLGPEFISTRPGPGNQKIAYLSAEKAINLANEVFGFNGWSSSIQNIQIDFVDENATTSKVSLGLSVVLRVTLRDGTYHEDIGYGGIENCKNKAMAFEKSKKEATTDALKRALRSFGNVLGNCMYDRDYITKVSKVKPGNGRFDVNELHRHPDFAPRAGDDVKPTMPAAAVPSKTPSLEFEDSFDVSEFDDIDFNDNDLAHSDEVLIPGDTGSVNPRSGARPGASTVNTPSKPPQPRPQVQQTASYPQHPGQQSRNVQGNPSAAMARPNVPPSRSFQGGIEDERSNDLSSPGIPSLHFTNQPGQAPLPGAPLMAPPAGFYSAKSAANVDPTNMTAVPASIVKFNPHAESPSIRKTAGVDHTKSVPVRRELQKAETNAPPNLVDPRGDPNRRIGMPGQPAPSPIGRPGMSTSAYRPPTRNASPAILNAHPGPGVLSNPPDRALTAAKRPPLGDVSNVQHNVTAITTDGAEAKRQKVAAGGPVQGNTENTPNVRGPGGS